VLPFSVLFLGVFNTLSARLSRKRLFDSIVAAFMLFLLCFAFLLFPNSASIHPHAAAEAWLRALPPGLAGGIAAVRNWSFSMFYCVAEMWGDIGLSLLFWSLANETTSMADAAVLYPLFGIGANVAQVFAGQCLKALGVQRGAAGGGFVPQLQTLTCVMLGLGTCIFALHEYISRSATFRPDTLDAPRRGGGIAGSAADNGAGVIARRGGDARTSGSNSDNGSSGPVRGADGPASTSAVEAGGHSAADGDLHLWSGPGVIMEVEVRSRTHAGLQCHLTG
jgi:ATP:ADP antiporter, AAA family